MIAPGDYYNNAGGYARIVIDITGLTAHGMLSDRRAHLSATAAAVLMLVLPVEQLHCATDHSKLFVSRLSQQAAQLHGTEVRGRPGILRQSPDLTVHSLPLAQ